MMYVQAPELLGTTSTASTSGSIRTGACDVFSFGVVLAEMLHCFVMDRAPPARHDMHRRTLWLKVHRE